MCGIAGILGRHTRDELDLISQLLARRGPDGHGAWTSDNSLVGLAHRRLAIIDLSDAARQPMPSADGRYVVVFNGEIYNFHSLAARLKARGYTFNENSDTAILAPLFDWLGPDMLKELSGIFAFVIYDKQTNKAFIARDEFGIKPFYYYLNSQRMVFASELKSVLALKDAPRDINPEALFSYMVYLWSPGEATMLQGIKKLLPGHCATFDLSTNKLDIRRWYSYPLPPIENGKPRYNDKKTPGDLAQILQTVVADQMVADVPVGAFLSGGLDSSAVVACAARSMQRPEGFNTFCINLKSDEMLKEGFAPDIDYARQVAKHLGVTLNEIDVSPDTLRDNLAQMIYYLDEPQADPAPIFVRIICERARAMGIKVLLGGTGGDDFFSGYRRHVLMASMDKYSHLPAPMIVGLLKAARLLPMGEANKRRINKVIELLGTSPEQALVGSFHFSSPSLLTRVLSPDMKQRFANRSKDYLEQGMELSRGQSLLDRQLNMELLGFLPDHNLNYTDKLSMAAGVEVRVPLLDRRMLDFAHDLPAGMKVRGQEAKLIFKQSMEPYLPHDVIYRPKTGFGAPVRQWMKHDLLGTLNDVLLSQKARERGFFDPNQVRQIIQENASGQIDAGFFLLSLLCVEYWMQQFHDPEIPTLIGG